MGGDKDRLLAGDGWMLGLLVLVLIGAAAMVAIALERAPGPHGISDEHVRRVLREEARVFDLCDARGRPPTRSQIALARRSVRVLIAYQAVYPNARLGEKPTPSVHEALHDIGSSRSNPELGDPRCVELGREAARAAGD